MARDAVEAYRAALEPETLEAMDALRSIIMEACPALVERIKWNAPSFALGDEDRITLGVERRGGVGGLLTLGVHGRSRA